MMNRAPIALGGLLVLLLAGCQQRTNSAVPLAPISPLGANTRVPPPQTGSYAVPDGYYRGQASTAPTTSQHYAAGAMPPASTAPSLAQSNGAQANGAPSTGALASSDPTNGGWSDAATVSTASAVQPAAYQSDAAGGFAGAPSSGEGQQSPAPRPQMRGMGVVDLTAPAPLQPTSPPSLQAVNPPAAEIARGGGTSSSAPPAFRSLSPAVDTASHEAAPAPQNQAEAPSTSKEITSADSAELPWRRPIR